MISLYSFTYRLAHGTPPFSTPMIVGEHVSGRNAVCRLALLIFAFSNVLKMGGYQGMTQHDERPRKK